MRGGGCGDHLRLIKNRGDAKVQIPAGTFVIARNGRGGRNPRLERDADQAAQIGRLRPSKLFERRGLAPRQALDGARSDSFSSRSVSVNHRHGYVLRYWESSFPPSPAKNTGLSTPATSRRSCGSSSSTENSPSREQNGSRWRWRADPTRAPCRPAAARGTTALRIRDQLGNIDSLDRDDRKQV